MKRIGIVQAFPALFGLSALICMTQIPPERETIPASVARLSADVKELQGILGRLEQSVAERAGTIEKLSKDLTDTREAASKDLETVKAKLEDGRQESLELRAAGSSSSGSLRADPGSGYSLSLAATPLGRNVELAATDTGGLLTFTDASESPVARFGTDRDGGTGFLELMSASKDGARFRSARLGVQPDGAGGEFGLNDSRGRELVLLRATEDGCELVLGDRHQMGRTNGPQRGIVLSVSSKGSFIMIDGKRFPE